MPLETFVVCVLALVSYTAIQGVAYFVYDDCQRNKRYKEAKKERKMMKRIFDAVEEHEKIFHASKEKTSSPEA